MSNLDKLKLKCASIVQGIERSPPKREIWVRVLLGAPRYNEVSYEGRVIGIYTKS